MPYAAKLNQPVNRFNALSEPLPPVTRHHRPHRSPRYNQSQRDRGWAVTKRRMDTWQTQRDIRDVQEMDAELSKVIDRLLKQANIPRPVPPLLGPQALTLPEKMLASPSPTRIPPTPPQLPLFNFGGLDLMDDFPPLSSVRPSPSPRKLSPALPDPPTTFSLPSWCPDVKLSGSPLFFDLSKLPDREIFELDNNEVPVAHSHHNEVPYVHENSLVGLPALPPSPPALELPERLPEDEYLDVGTYLTAEDEGWETWSSAETDTPSSSYDCEWEWDEP
jgi:hypothetical protein